MSSDNSSNRLANFSHILLNKIVKELNDNLDIFSFTLVCRRLYYDRDYYVVFNFNHILIYQSISELQCFYWNSYKKLIEYSKSIKPNCKLCICSTDELSIYKSKNHFFDYVFDYEEYFINGKPLVIPSNVKSIVFSNRFNQSLELLREQLSLSNVTSLLFGEYFNQILLPGCIPSTVTSISLSQNFNQMLEVGSLPPSLTNLIFGPDYNKPLRPGVLPQSLRYLELGESFDQQFEHGSLPPNLVEIVFYNDEQSPIIDANVIPGSLRAIENIPPSWVEQLDLMPQLNRISFKKLPFIVFPEGIIPPNITKLDFGFSASFKLGPNVLPPSLKSLKLGRCNYRLEQLFKNESNYELDVLYLGSTYNHPISPNALPKVKRLMLPENYNYFLEKGAIPDGVESLDLVFLFSQDIGPGTVPSSCKELRLSGLYDRPLKVGSIPDGVEVLDLRYYDQVISEPTLVLPQSVKTIWCHSNFLIKNPVQTLPSTLTNIHVSTISKDYKFRRIDSNYFLVICGATNLEGGIIESKRIRLIIEPSNSSSESLLNI